MSTPITSALVVCVAAAGVAAGALFLEAGDDNPAPAPTASTAAPAANTGTKTNTGGGAYGDSPDNAGGDTGGAAPSGAPATANLTISGFQFSSVEVAAGGQVTVTNQDSAPHTATADDGAFDTGTIEGGSAATFTAPSQPGTYDFHCNIHSGMSGTLSVR